MKLISGGNIFMPDGTLLGRNIIIDNGRITKISEELPPDCDQIDASGCIVAPGFVDMHIHGAAGADFSDADSKGIDRIATYLISQGVTAFLGTTMSYDEERLANVCETAAPLVGNYRADKAVLQGVRLEGPFINRDKKGAHNEKYIIKPDYNMFLRLYEKSKGSIHMLDIAPELEGSMEFIEKAKELCKVSIAHSEADYETAITTFEKGASHVTHLFNAMNPIHHRTPGIIPAAVDAAEFVEIICDGVHLHPSIVRLAFRLFGRDRVCIISDSMQACGMAEGEYSLGGQQVYVLGDRAVLSDHTLAGSVTSVAEGLRNAVEYGIKLEDALLAVTRNPARAAGLGDCVGSLKVGNSADLVILDKELRVQRVLLEGREVI